MPEHVRSRAVAPHAAARGGLSNASKLLGVALACCAAGACAVQPAPRPSPAPTVGDQAAVDPLPAAAPSASQPDIVDPGPDFGYIPNSTQTVQPGRTYIETAFQSTRSGDRSVRTDQLPMLIRFGAAGGLELRAQMNVITRVDDPFGKTTGHGPLTLGFKARFNKGRVGAYTPRGKHRVRRLRDEQGILRPSVGFEAEFSLPVASAGFDSGKLEPTLTLNVDHFVTPTSTLTWNLGAAGPVDEAGEQFVQGILSAAWNQWVTGEAQLYATGEWRTPTSGSGAGEIGRVGTGLYWYMSQRVVLFGAFNWGLTDEALATDGTVGVTFAF